MPSCTRMLTYAHVCSRMLVKVVPRRVALENGAMPAGEAAAKQHLQELSKEEEAAIVNAEAAVVGGLVKHVIPRVDDTASREDLLMLLDNLVGAASGGAASRAGGGKKDVLARNCLEGLLGLAEGKGKRPLAADMLH